MHGVPGCEEHTDQEPSIQLDAHHDLRRILGVCRHHLVQLRRSVDAFGHTALGQYAPLDVQDAGVVMGLRPIDPDEDHPSSFPS
jgi:arginase family enzyme